MLETIVALIPSLEKVIVIVAELFPGPAVDTVPARVEPAKSKAAIAMRIADTDRRLRVNAPAGAKEFCRIFPPSLAADYRLARFSESFTKKGEAEVPVRGNRR